MSQRIKKRRVSALRKFGSTSALAIKDPNDVRSLKVVGSYNGAGRIESRNPAIGIGRRIEEALNPQLAPRPVRTWADMTPEERAAIAAQVTPPRKPKP